MKKHFWIGVICLLLLAGNPLRSQVDYEQVHRRGRLWETLQNDGWIGSLGAWDYKVSVPLGLFPGFTGYVHPIGGETYAENAWVNANYHNFRSGVWILAKNLEIPGLPPDFPRTEVNYEVFLSGLQTDSYGVEEDRAPIQLLKNYIEEDGFNPLLPEEMTFAYWHTNTGITVTRYSYVWSYPGYCDFIIYDYHFKNTGKIVSNDLNEVIEGFDPQELKDVYFAFHSGISVSTKSQINFHSDLRAVQAGGFGWQQPYHDYYRISGDRTLVFSFNNNGGRRPLDFDPEPKKDSTLVQQRFGVELQSPAAFGWLALYASLKGSKERSSPAPDVLRVDSHKGGTFRGNDLDMEGFRYRGWEKEAFYAFAAAPDTQAALGNKGNRMNFYTLSYGPYDLAPDDSVRFILAEIAGVMDYAEVVAGDTNGWFPDSTIAAIERNAEFARQAVAWGMGREESGIPLAADAPEPPPGPKVIAANVSLGSETPLIAVTWDDLAETATILDGAENVFYDGSTDLDGYIVYRSNDFQFVTEGVETVLRGAFWEALDTIPRSEFAEYWDETLGKYKYINDDLEFGRRFSYYVAAYNENPGTWISANGSEVTNLPTLVSGSYNRTVPTEAQPGPVESFDIFVAPNPYIYNDPVRSFGRVDPYKVEFRNLPEACVIRIYTVSGDLIRTITHEPDKYGNLAGSEAWSQRSDAGLLVAPGLYIYHVESTTEELNETFVGKLMLIR